MYPWKTLESCRGRGWRHRALGRCYAVSQFATYLTAQWNLEWNSSSLKDPGYAASQEVMNTNMGVEVE